MPSGDASSQRVTLLTAGREPEQYPSFHGKLGIGGPAL
jgi:hypothetical protein